MAGAGATIDPGPNVNPRNPHNPMPAIRALLVALDEWVVSGTAPPPSRVPTLAAGTLVEPDKTGFPAVPGAAIVRTTNRGTARRLRSPSPWKPIEPWARSTPTATRWPASACPTSRCRSRPTPVERGKQPYPGRDRRPRRQLSSAACRLRPAKFRRLRPPIAKRQDGATTSPGSGGVATDVRPAVAAETPNAIDRAQGTARGT
jgi:hypothetical protein